MGANAQGVHRRGVSAGQVIRRAGRRDVVDEHLRFAHTDTELVFCLNEPTGSLPVHRIV